jgi:16S rRNA (adenine1518-N6/adenine1519-N6)-dimethyltransferase
MPTLGRRRALGQHFLRDRAVCDKIADAALGIARDHHCKALLEIGPGRGAITLPLIERVRATPEVQKFIVSERDPKLVTYWDEERTKGAFDGIPEVELAFGDFMELAESEWLGLTPLCVASNLPYSAGTAIVTRLARHPGPVAGMVLMFQAEVAKRLRAEPGTKAWGSLSVWIQNRWDVTKLVAVPPGAFSPPPEVDSEVVVIIPRSEPRVPVPPDSQSEARWESLLKQAFAHRRKMLRSGLPPSGPWRNALDAAQVDGTKRAEALSWEEWSRLERALRELER